MLTGDLLAYRLRNGKFQIRFVDPTEPDLLSFAGTLIAAFQSAAERHISRSRLEEELELFRLRIDPKTAGALIKLLMDRTDFRLMQEEDYPRIRRELFLETAGRMQNSGGSWERYRESLPFSPGTEDIYGDLPGYEQISSFSFLKPVDLLTRCNLAFAQGMLFFAETLAVKVSDPDAAELRRMFKYLKFFRLLARIVSLDKSSAELEISGPYSLFGAARKYALNLAVFLPAVIRLKKWKISARLQTAGKSGVFELDERSGLVSHYRNFSAYVPEEVKMFHRLFSEKISDWKIIGDTPVLHSRGQNFIVPDLSFAGENGGIIHLELFHRWHKIQLEERLEDLRDPALPLILGIDRSIMNDREFAQLTECDPGLKKKIFRFSDFPGVETVHRLLKSGAKQD